MGVLREIIVFGGWAMINNIKGWIRKPSQEQW
jgi:hypothetical protein